MALGRTNRTPFTNGGTNTSTTASSGAFAPTAGAGLLMLCAQGQQGATSRNFTVSDTFGDAGGTAWTELGTLGDGNWFLRVSIWYRKIGTTPSSGTITMTRDNATSATWALWGQPIELTGYDTTTINKQALVSAENGVSGALSITFGANFTSGGMVFGVVVGDSAPANTIAPGANYTEIFDTYDAGMDVYAEGEEWITPTSVNTIDWSGLPGVNKGIAIEIAAAAGGGGGFPPVPAPTALQSQMIAMLVR